MQRFHNGLLTFLEAALDLLLRHVWFNTTYILATTAVFRYYVYDLRRCPESWRIWCSTTNPFKRGIMNNRTHWPLKMLVTEVPKYTNLRFKFQRNVRGTSMGLILLPWSAKTCKNITKTSSSSSTSNVLYRYKYVCRTAFAGKKPTERKSLYLIDLEIRSIQREGSFHSRSAWHLQSWQTCIVVELTSITESFTIS